MNPTQHLAPPAAGVEGSTSAAAAPPSIGALQGTAGQTAEAQPSASTAVADALPTPRPPTPPPDSPPSRAATWVARLLRALMIAAAVAMAVYAGLVAFPREEAPAAAATWTCPMHPQVVAPSPGQCPICNMDLVPARDGGAASPAVEADGRVRLPAPTSAAPTKLHAPASALLGVILHTVVEGERTQQRQAAAALTVDPLRVARVSAESAGVLRTLAEVVPGDRIKRGQVLASLYSREVDQAQIEARVALSAAAAMPGLDTKALERATQDRLRALGGRKRGGGVVEVAAPFDAVVLSRDAVVGGYVGAGGALFTVADLSTLVLFIEVPVAEAAEWLKAANVAFEARDGTRGVAAIEGATPDVQPSAETVQVRARIANTDGSLRPGLTAIATLDLPTRRALYVPRDAVLGSGRERYVLRVVGEPSSTLDLLPTAVEVAERVGEDVRVVAGLHAGDRIVRRGHFLLDVEAKLAAAVARARAAADPAGAPVFAPAAATATAAGAAWPDAGEPGTGGDPAAALRAVVALQAALAADDAAGANAAALDLAKVAPVGGGLQARAAGFPATLTEQRAVLAPLMESALDLARRHPSAATGLHAVVCTMAKGRWLQGHGEVANPYYGAAMLRCGEELGPASAVSP